MNNNHSSTPLYNTKAVAHETGVPADTFRAWERRYGIPRPQRTDGGHRLYSEREIAIIRWLRDRTTEGLTISQAIALLSDAPDLPLLTPSPASIISSLHDDRYSWEQITDQLINALVRYDERQAEQCLGHAFALYPLNDVLTKLITHVLVEIGERWHRGTISITVEHFATEFIRRKLFSILNTYAGGGAFSYAGGGAFSKVVIGCAPSEIHDIGALLLAVTLVRHGMHVIYLGGQVPQHDLILTIHDVQPRIVCLSASTHNTALELIDVGKALATSQSSQRTMFGYGGRIFHEAPTLRERIAGTYLGDTVQDALATISASLVV